jgi:formylglycine-generating enzyme required for sulfatase activity/uncharacterized protein YbaP (TraB family)
MITRLFITLLFIGPFPALCEDFLWKAEVENRRIYLGGSVHYLRSEDYPIPAVFDRAFNDSKMLVLESDIDLSATQPIQDYINSKALLPSEKKLYSIVPISTYNAVQNFGSNHGYISTAFDGYRPWFINTFFANLTYSDLGFSADLGVDRKYLNLAKNQNKSRQFLETPQEAIDALASVPEPESVKSLNEQAGSINKGLLPVTNIDNLIKSWKSGDPQLYDPILLKMSIEYPQTFDAIVKKRNLLWLPKIENLLTGSDRAFVLVGALHYSGEYSLLKLLSAKGYSVSRAIPIDFLPKITSFPTNINRTVGQAAVLTVSAISGIPLTYQWKKSGIPISNGGGITGVTTESLSIASLQLVHAGDYSVTIGNSVGNVTSPVATLTVNPAIVAPSITSQPQSLIVTEGQVAQFSIVAAGSSPLNYQWQKDGQNIGGATSANFTIPSVQAANAGNYRVIVSNSAGSVSSAIVSLSTKVVLALPTIAVQPVSTVLQTGQRLMLTVQATGAGQLGYQWQKGGANIAGATAAQLTIQSVTSADAGEYRVLVNNSAGAIASAIAVVAVLPSNVAPAITVQPVALSIIAGQPFELKVTATGNPAPSYQWKRNGTDLVGATEATFSKLSATVGDSGSYQVLVFNTVGQVLSAKVFVNVDADGPITPASKVSIRMVPEVSVYGDNYSQWSLEWSESMNHNTVWFPLTNIVMSASGVQVIDLSEAQAGRFYRTIGGYVGVPAQMAVIPSGPFKMGAGIVGSAPIHTVNVSRFLIDRYEVSKELWDKVRAWAVVRNYNLPIGSSFAGPLQPIHSVNWYDAIKWCNARSEMEGVAPAYYTDSGFRNVYRSGELVPFFKKNTGYRLPTEAEWEKAARGGYTGKEFPWPESVGLNPTAANYSDSMIGQTTAVSSYPANGFGLYNVSGNVWEWCWDYYGEYSSIDQTDPQGPIQGSARVIRGGGWDNADIFCRVFSRISNGAPTSRGNSLGFRTVRSAQ